MIIDPVSAISRVIREQVEQGFVEPKKGFFRNDFYFMVCEEKPSRDDSFVLRLVRDKLEFVKPSEKYQTFYAGSEREAPEECYTPFRAMTTYLARSIDGLAGKVTFGMDPEWRKYENAEEGIKDYRLSKFNYYSKNKSVIRFNSRSLASTGVFKVDFPFNDLDGLYNYLKSICKTTKILNIFPRIPDDLELREPFLI